MDSGFMLLVVPLLLEEGRDASSVEVTAAGEGGAVVLSTELSSEEASETTVEDVAVVCLEETAFVEVTEAGIIVLADADDDVDDDICGAAMTGELTLTSAVGCLRSCRSFHSCTFCRYSCFSKSACASRFARDVASICFQLSATTRAKVRKLILP